MQFFNILKRFATAACLAVALLGLTSAAHAHTGLKESFPGEGAVLNAAPEHLHLVFTAAVNLVRLNLLTADERKIDLDFSPETEARTEYRFPVNNLPVGKYQIEWSVIGADGHTVTGEIAFTLDPDADQVHGGHHAEGGHSH